MFLFSSIHCQCLYRPDAQSIYSEHVFIWLDIFFQFSPMFLFSSIHCQCLYRRDAQSIYLSIIQNKFSFDLSRILFSFFAHVLVFFHSFSMLLPTRRSIYSSIRNSIHPSDQTLNPSIHFQCLYRPDAQSIQTRHSIHPRFYSLRDCGIPSFRERVLWSLPKGSY